MSPFFIIASTFSIALPENDGINTPLPQVHMEQSIASRELTIERKHFIIELRQNERGRFLKITEAAHGRRNSVIIPSTGLDEFEDKLDEVLTEGEEIE
jgi:hypothetical protein